MKSLDRRAVLKGACGISMGLPFLDAMAVRKSSGKPPVRVAYFYMSNGIGPHSIWNPKKEGKNFDLHSALEPLKPVSDLINVHTGLNHNVIHNGHNNSTAGLLSGKNVKRNTKLVAATTIDQLIAKEIGQDSYLPSLELSIDKSLSVISADGSNSSLGGHLSWSSPTDPIPREVNPTSAFNRLFKDLKSSGGNASTTKSVLDYVRDDAKRLQRVLGREDTQKLNQYFYSVREIERRLAKIDNSARLPSGTKAPKDVTDRSERIKAMIDIMVLAFQTNRTKVASFMMANDQSQLRYRWLPGVKTSHHSYSHHNDAPNNVNALKEIAKYHIGFYAQMIKKMSMVNEANGTLLDNSLLLFTSNFKSGHGREDMPCIIAGKGGGSVETGIHTKHKDKLYSSMLLGMAKTAGCKRLSSFAGTSEAII
ncbi:MAG: DUF1552 domain-containing protein [Lentisphaeraceae bacterium]|nr:DUF1552 domain-containing protein [Lentisphaeraceae bacterium]